MPYAIGYIVFGVAVGSNHKKGVDTELCSAIDTAFPGNESELYASEKAGFESLYEGPSCMWFGVRMGSLDECDNYDLADLPRVTPDVVSKYFAKLEALPKPVRDLMPAPKWQIIWSSS